MEYKDTLNLPRTDFAMKADLVAREPQRLEKWATARLYEQIQAARAGAEKFILHDGPPFANGDLHIGHALNKILKDIIIKFHTLRGKQTPYVPGWDCHGLPIEFKVSQEMRKAGDTSADASKIRLACEIYARQFIDIQRAQFKRLGVLGDWDNPYLTLNKEYEADELRLFADIVDKGFVYRGKKPVWWSIPARTALAEAEVEYANHVSQSVYVKFPVVGQPDLNVVIWTTTPWTLPANLAVAFNKDFQYVTARVGQERFIVFRGLLPAVAEKCGWTDYEEKPFAVEELARLEYQHPFCKRTGKLYAAEFVTSDTGTGFVHIAPGHGQDDYNLGLRVGLPIYSPVDDNGCFAYTNDLPAEQQMPAEMIGKAILEKHGKSDANEAVLHELRVRHALLKQENYHHSYPHCWRSKTPVIFRAMAQWFIRIDHVPVAATVRSQATSIGSTTAEKSARDLTVAATFRQLALGAIDSVNWIPDWGKNRIESAVKSRPDWCISRQRSWGVPIPAFYDAQGGPILDPLIVRAAADLVQHHGSNVWFEKPAAELWSLLRPKDWKGPEAAAKSADTLDVWIDSGSSSRAVTSRRPELARSADLPVGSSVAPANAPSRSSALQPFQADMYLEGSDQHRGWFQSSLLLSLAGNGAPPYKTVLTHGFMVDEDREKFSKSKQTSGAYDKPQTSDAYVKKWGADVVRLWVASQDYRNDIVVSEKRIEKVGETYRILRNALRYQLSNLYDFDPAKHTVPDAQLTGLDRWILGEFARLEAVVLPAYEAYEFHTVYQKLSQFAAVELSATYHDAVKDRLYTDAANSTRRRSTQIALHRMVTQLCQMLSPILVFTTDEAWEFVPGKTADSVHLSTWQPSSFALREGEKEVWESLFALREIVLPKLEEARRAKLIGKSLEARLALSGTTPALAVARDHTETLRELLNVSQLSIVPGVTKSSQESGLVDLNLKLPNGLLGELYVQVSKAAGQKCERCWHWEEDVGRVAAHPTICGRCVEAVNQSA